MLHLAEMAATTLNISRESQGHKLHTEVQINGSKNVYFLQHQATCRAPHVRKLGGRVQANSDDREVPEYVCWECDVPTDTALGSGRVSLDIVSIGRRQYRRVGQVMDRIHNSALRLYEALRLLPELK
jgi:hypothetical protein